MGVVRVRGRPLLRPVVVGGQGTTGGQKTAVAPAVQPAIQRRCHALDGHTPMRVAPKRFNMLALTIKTVTPGTPRPFNHSFLGPVCT